MASKAAAGALILGGATLLASACSGSGSAASAKSLKGQVCTSPDLGQDFRIETQGDFTVGNLADLAADASTRKKALEDAGMEGGYFAYWKHHVGGPPFPPPAEVVCQAMEFATDADAGDFVAAMKPTPEDLATSAIAWVPDSNRKVAEEDLTVGDLPSARAFKLTASDSNVSLSLDIVVVASGRYVRSVYAGGERGADELGQAEAIQQRMEQRLR